MKRYLIFLIFLASIFTFSSCGVNSYVMFKTKKDEVITENIPMSPSDYYRLAVNDKISFLIFTEDGKRIIDMGASVSEDGSSSGGAQLTRGKDIEYLIQKDGRAELPMIGWIELEGLSIIEVQDKLKELFSAYYVNPFIQVHVTNRRVLVFPGSGGTAKVVPIINDNMTLMEAIASAGGITERGRAKKVKIMRLTDSGREVYQIDLSTIDGLMYADMVVQSNDYIYVEPTKQLSREFLKEVTPIVSLLSSAILIISIITSFK